jgi:hypothetical protein
MDLIELIQSLRSWAECLSSLNVGRGRRVPGRTMVGQGSALRRLDTKVRVGESEKTYVRIRANLLKV